MHDTKATPVRMACAHAHGPVYRLYLHNSKLRGTIPTELGNLSNLKGAKISFNKELKGPIPKELFNISGLEQLKLHSNRLTGTIPKEVSKLRNMATFWVDNNALVGFVPTDVLADLVVGNSRIDATKRGRLKDLYPNCIFYGLAKLP